MQDLPLVQTKLNDGLFAATQETCLALCRVQDIGKKSKDKMYILCACSKYIGMIIGGELLLGMNFSLSKIGTSPNAVSCSNGRESE